MNTGKHDPICKDDLLMDSLIKFYKIKKNMTKLLPIITGDSNISLRIIDWFVTNYSKKRNIIIVAPKINLIVYLEYKSQLKAYSKKQFDPFQRRDRISFVYDENEPQLTTTVGQLNFFRWAIQNKILDYIEKNIKSIENDMNESIKSAYKTKKMGGQHDTKKSRKKRHELSISAMRSVNKHDIKIMVTFE